MQPLYWEILQHHQQRWVLPLPREGWSVEPNPEALWHHAGAVAFLWEGDQAPNSESTERLAAQVGWVRQQVNGTQGQPLPETAVAVVFQAVRLLGKTDAEGWMEYPLRVGAHAPRIEVPGHGAVCQVMLVVEPERGPVHPLAPLEPFGTLTGRVLPHTSLMLTSSTIGEQTLRADEAGNFTQELLPGVWRAWYPEPEPAGGWWGGSAEVLAGQTATITFQRYDSPDDPHFWKEERRPQRQVTLRGQVFDHNGLPACGVEVRGKLGRGDHRDALHTTTTDGRGEFVFIGDWLMAQLAAYIPGAAPVVMDWHCRSWERSHYRVITELLCLRAPQPTEVGALTLHLHSETGEPVVGQAVRLRDPLACRLPRQITDAAGGVHFSELLPGTYDLELEQEGQPKSWVRQTIRSVPVVARETTHYTVRRSLPLPPLVFALPEGYPTTGRLSAHSATTSWATQAQADASLLLSTRYPGLQCVSVPEPDRRNCYDPSTDAFGVGWRAVVACTALLPYTQPRVFRRIAPRPPTLTVRVLDGAGKAVDGQHLTVMGLPQSATTDAQGDASFAGLAPRLAMIKAGEDSLHVWLKAEDLTVTLTRGERARQRDEKARNQAEWAQRPKRDVRIKVTDPMGSPAVGAYRYPFEGKHVGAEGDYLLRSLADDEPVECCFVAPGLGGRLTLAPGITEATLVLETWAPLRGRVTIGGRSPESYPALELQVVLQRQDIWGNGQPLVVTPQSDGSFWCTTLFPGAYKVQAVLENLWFTPVGELVWDGSAKEIFLEIPVPGAPVVLEGLPPSTLLHWEQRPEAIAFDGAVPEYWWTDTNGALTLEGLPCGEHLLRIGGTPQTVAVTVSAALP